MRIGWALDVFRGCRRLSLNFGSGGQHAGFPRLPHAGRSWERVARARRNDERSAPRRSLVLITAQYVTYRIKRRELFDQPAEIVGLPW